MQKVNIPNLKGALTAEQCQKHAMRYGATHISNTQKDSFYEIDPNDFLETEKVNFIYNMKNGEMCVIGMSKGYGFYKN